MAESKRKWTKLVFSAAFLLLVFICFVLLENGSRKKERESGVPDVVSSRIHNDECDLLVVANSSQIENRQKFAEKVIDMYRNNGFLTTRFSRDMGEMPKKLYVKVYLREEDVERGKDLFRFCYDTSSRKIILNEAAKGSALFGEAPL